MKNLDYDELITIARGQKKYQKEKSLLQQYLEDQHPLLKKSIYKEINDVREE